MRVGGVAWVSFAVSLLVAADEHVAPSCATIVSDSERLACYDAQAREDGRSHGPATVRDDDSRTTVSEDVIGHPSNELEHDSEAMFGKTARAPESRPDHIVSRIERIEETPLGKRVMTLANGQVWMENEPGHARIRVDDDVTISRGLLAFTMSLPSGRSTRVHRIDGE